MSTAKFDHSASGYDAEFTQTSVGRMQRKITWDWLELYVKRNNPQTVLELNCGTGEDALFMANLGLNVTATDFSAEMLRLTAQKTQGKHVETIHTGIQTLADALSGQKFDLIWSNFGGFNCLNAHEIKAASNSIANLLNPGGQFVAVVMGKICIWESLYFLAKLKPSQAFRRLKRGPIPARLAEGIYQDTYYYSPKEFEQLCAGEFQPLRRLAVGAFLPPSYLDPFFQKHPKLLRQMARWEKNSSEKRFPASFSDHFLLAFELK